MIVVERCEFARWTLNTEEGALGLCSRKVEASSVALNVVNFLFGKCVYIRDLQGLATSASAEACIVGIWARKRGVLQLSSKLVKAVEATRVCGKNKKVLNAWPIAILKHHILAGFQFFNPLTGKPFRP